MVLLTIATLSSLSAAEPVKKVLIPINNSSPSSIGSFPARSGTEQAWAPTIFAIDQKGNIIIPDFYKSRITVFDTNGSFQSSIEVVKGIGPSMTFFSITEADTYLTCVSGTLFCLKRDGTLIWETTLPLGFLPDRIVLNKDLLFLKAQSMNKKALVLAREDGAILGLMGKETGDRVLPLFIDDTGRRFGFSLEAMEALGLWTFEEALPNALFSGFAGDGTSYWLSEEREKVRLYRYASEGKLLGEAECEIIPMGNPNGVHASCFDGKNYYLMNRQDDTLLLRIYSLTFDP